MKIAQCHHPSVGTKNLIFLPPKSSFIILSSVSVLCAVCCALCIHGSSIITIVPLVIILYLSTCTLYCLVIEQSIPFNSQNDNSTPISYDRFVQVQQC